MTGTLRLLAVLAAVAAVIAGCSSDAPENGDTATAGSTGGAKTTTAQGKALRFAECMRDNGVREFPDPDPSGELTIDAIANGSSVDTSSPAWNAAISACRDLQPAGFTGRERSAAQQDEALRFAQCIREHGVKDFPDPTEGEPLVDTNRIPSAATDGGMSILNAAMRRCGDLVQDIVSGP